MPDRFVGVAIQSLSATHTFSRVPFLTPRIAHNMRAILGEEFRSSWVRRNLQVLYRSAADLLRMPQVSEDRLLEQLGTLENDDELRQRRAAGVGCVLVGLHFGNHRFLAPGLAAMDFPVSNLIGGFPQPTVGLGRTTENRVSKFRATYVDKSRVDYIRPGGDERKRILDVLVQRVEQGRFLFLLADGCVGQRRESIPFLGCELALPVGAAIIAARAAVPLVPILSLPSCRKVIVGDPIAVDGSSPRQAMCRVMAKLEPLVRAEPWQWWTWFHLGPDDAESGMKRWRLLSGAEAFTPSFHPQR